MTSPAQRGTTLPDAGHPDLQPMFAAAERIWADREDLRGLYGSIENIEFWIWLVWHGIDEDPELRRACLPEPPPELLERVAGWGCSMETFRRGGIVDWRRVVTTLREAGFTFERGSVLEFGCGCGRILRHFARFAHACRFTGIDIDAEAVAWCRENLRFAGFSVTPPLPPSALPAARFDAAYSYSVFSHLPLEAQRAWIGELARVLRPGALAVLTFHGRRARERWLDGSAPSTTPTADELRAALPQLEREGYLFFPFGRMESSHASNERHWEEMDRAMYGNVFLTREFIEREWTGPFELVALHEAPDDWQDFVVLRRRG